MAAKKKSKKAKKTKTAKIKKAPKAKKVTRAKKAGKAKKPVKAKKKTGKAKKAKKVAKARKAVKAKRSAKRASPLEGEGSYTAARNYDHAQEEFVAHNRGKIAQMGKAAEDALEGPEGEELREAEREGRAKARE